MSGGVTLEFTFTTPERRKGRKSKEKPVPPPRIPRIAKTMALAIQMGQLIRDGVVKDQAELARIGGVTRARVTQIMNMLCLAPDIQKEILFLPRIGKGPGAWNVKGMQEIATAGDWTEQRRRWSQDLRKPDLGENPIENPILPKKLDLKAKKEQQ